MKLTPEHRERLAERGIRGDEVCDKCGKLLGAVRYTRRGEIGEWCSELCRDGADQAEARKERRGGRPRKYRTERERRAANMRYQRNHRERAQRKKNHLAAS
jgi:hypothetical protein